MEEGDNPNMTIDELARKRRELNFPLGSHPSIIEFDETAKWEPPKPFEFSKPKEWFVFDIEDIAALLRALDVNVQEAMPDVYEFSRDNASVVRHDRAWAGPSLHMIAQAISLAKSLAFDSDQADALQEEADYFHGQAMEADKSEMYLPGAD